jgi:hypothetical protein
MTSEPGRRWQALAGKMLLLIATSLICLLLLELAVRLLFPYYVPGSQVPLQRSDEGIVLGIPLKTVRQHTPKGDFDSTVTFNRHGLRDPRDLAESRTNDIFVAGDSFSIGWGVEEPERYSSILEKALDVPCYNIAIPEDIRGYIATVNYAQKRGAKIHHLVVGLCMENDIWDYTQSVSTHLIYAQQMNRGLLRRVTGWFKGHSALWICVSHLVQGSVLGRRVFEKFGVAKDIEALTHKNEYSPQILASTRDELLKLTTNFNSVVLIIPSRGLWHGKNVPVEEKIHDEMVQLLRNSGLAVVDMRPVFEKSGRPLQYYFANDPHWNAAGHRLAGETLANFLRTKPGWSSHPLP